VAVQLMIMRLNGGAPAIGQRTARLHARKAPVLLIHGRYGRMVQFEVSIAILNHVADWHLVRLNNSGHWLPC
jgi:pimeloyl-ACP methyl ester carboxylesterase